MQTINPFDDNPQLLELQQEIYDAKGCWVCNDLLYNKFQEKCMSAEGTEEEKVQQAIEAVKILFT